MRTSLPLLDTFLRMIAALAPYRLFIMTVTAVAAAFIAAVVLWLHKRELNKERWLRYFGLAFACSSLQYLIPSLVMSYGAAPSRFLAWVAAIASASNNVLILAAAFALTRRRSPPWWYWTAVCAAALISMGVSIGGSSSFWNRSPDALFSAVALFTFGFAMYRNIVPRRQSGLAALALLVVLLYAGLHVVYALNPWLTEGGGWPALRDTLAFHLAGPGITPRQAIDTSLIAWALLLRALLAAGGFVLIFRALATFSPKALAVSLQEVHKRGADFFIGEGFIRMLGRNLQADRAAVCFRLPGLREQEVAWWEWFRNPTKPVARKARVTPLPRPKESAEGWVLEHGVTYERSRLSASDPFWSAEASLPPSMIVVPIVFRGNLTGCLTIEWYDEYAFRPTVVQQLTLMADLFAPAIENRRRLAAVHYWVREIQSIDFLRSGYRGGAAEIATLAHRTLAPLAVRLSIQVGFQPIWAVAGDHGQISGALEHGTGPEMRRALHTLAGVAPEELDVRRVRLEIGQIELEMGTLSLAWPKAGLAKTRTRPLVFPEFVLRRTIAAFIVTAVLDALHIGLTNVLNNLQTALNKPFIRTRKDWFSTIEAAVRELGLLWLVTIHPPHGDPQGQEHHVGIVRGLEPLPTDPQEDPPALQLLPLPAPLHGTWKLLRLDLRTSKALLWLGVGNPRFGPEIQGHLPWQVFLSRLAAAADSALSRITSREEMQRLQDEADRSRLFSTTSTEAVAFFHECRNIARNFTLSVQSLQEAWILKLLTAPPNVAPSIANDLSGLLMSAQRLHHLADALMQSRFQATHIARPLIEVVQAVQETVQSVVSDLQIELETAIDGTLLIKTPLYVAHLALLSLVMNSLDALRSSGTGSRIGINAEDHDSLVLCRVTDDGPGISSDMRPRVFDLGISSKNTGGMGLFIVRNLLEQHDAKVWLEDSSPGLTVFTIAFPKASDKGSDKGAVYEPEGNLAR